MKIFRIPMTRERIIRNIHEGVLKGKKKHEDLRKSRWVDHQGRESTLVDGISEALIRRQNRHEDLHLEKSVKKIGNSSGADSRRGRLPKELTGRDRRVDIALLNDQERPTCVIEVKREWNAGCYGDLGKIYSLVRTYSPKRGGTLELGFLAILLVLPSSERRWNMDQKIDYIIRSSKEEFKARGREAELDFNKRDIRERFKGSECQSASLVIEILA